MSNINTQGFGIQLAPAGFPLEANKIFVDYAAALEFVKTKPAAYVGSIITVSAPSTIDGVTYPKGAYIVDAVGENAVLTQVGKETDLSDYVHKNDVATKGDDKVLKTNSAGKIEVDTTGNAATATHAADADKAETATNLEDAPILSGSTSDANKITVKAGGKTSAAFTVPFATKSTSADSAAEATHAASADSATNATNAVNATNAALASRLDWNNVRTSIEISAGSTLVDTSAFISFSLTTHTIIDVHATSTLFVGDVNTNDRADTYFAVKFNDDALNSAYEIISVKSNGFAIPMTKTSDNVYKSNSLFVKGTIVEGVEIMIKKI